MSRELGTFGALFSGCAGLDVGLESVGWRCLWQVENDPACSALLEQRFPGVPNYGDVTATDWASLPPVDGIVGGFPCQDLSYAGRGAGLEGDRSGLYYFMADAIRAIRPKLVLIENVPGLLGRGLHVVTHDLARAGYVGTWRTLAAADVGAPHRRDRVFVLARLAGEADEVAGGIALADFAEDGWEEAQASLFGRELLEKMPKAGAWTLARVFAYELPEKEDEILLLPSPQASESTPTGVEPDHRLYLPGRKWHVQRTLSRIVPTLLPTPGANDATGAEGETRDARREDGSTGGPSLRDLPKLLPTPTSSDVNDGPSNQMRRGRSEPDNMRTAVRMLPTPTGRDHKGQNQRDDDSCLPGAVDKLLPTPTAGDAAASGSRNLEGSKAHPGVSLTDAVRFGDSKTPRRLLPTPTVADAEGGRTSKGTERPDEHGLAVEMKLLPTPVANQENPGAGGELRAAIHHGPERRTDSDTDTMGRPIRKGREEKLLPTPNAGLGEHRRDNGQDPERRREQGKQVSLADVARYEVGDRPEKLLPTPNASDGPKGGPNRRDGNGEPYLSGIQRLLPTPQASDGDGGRLDRDPETLATGKRPSGSKASVPLATAIDRDVLLPTPTAETNRKSERAMTSSGSGAGNGKRSGGGMSSPPGLEQVAELAVGIEPRDFPPYEDLPPETRAIVDAIAADRAEIAWGDYEPAIRRWEATLLRAAPQPTDEKGRLDPRFVEWMLGFPYGWVDLAGVKRTAQLRMLGNSVQVQVGQVVGIWLAELGGLA